MRKALLWAALGLGLALAGGCGAGKESKKRPGVDFGGADSGGTDSGGTDSGAGALAAGRAGSGTGGEDETGGLAQGGSDASGGTSGAAAGRGGEPATGGGPEGGGGAATGGALLGGEGGFGATPTGGSPPGGFAGQGTGGYDVTVGVGAVCEAHTDCRAGQLCYDGLGADLRSCRVQCDLAAVGTQGDCLADQLCVQRQVGDLAGCLEVCEPFQTPSDCEDGDYCYPNPDPSYTGGEAVSGLCLTAGTGTSQGGQSCETSDCADGLMCYQPASELLGHDHCEQACDPGAVPGDPGACPTGQLCRVSLVGDAACLEICDIGADTCDDGEWCAPYDDWDGARVIEGHCVQPGTLELNAECNLGECVEGLVCAQLPPPFHDDRTCRAVCDPDADPCVDGATCIDIYNGDTGLGTCEAPCTLFGVGTADGCVAEQWCAPTHLGEGAGTCVDVGAVVAGDPCVRSADCVAGHFCDCRFGFNSSCGGDPVCAAACVPGATDPEPGSCPIGQTCTRLPIFRQVSTFGVCREECDYDGTNTCADTSETCVPGELLPDNVDACIDIPPGALSFGDDCRLLGVDDGDVCGPTALCIIPDGVEDPATCEDVCRVSAGAIGSSPHPDCLNASHTCTEIEPGLPYGRCE